MKNIANLVNFCSENMNLCEDFRRRFYMVKLHVRFMEKEMFCNQLDYVAAVYRIDHSPADLIAEEYNLCRFALYLKNKSKLNGTPFEFDKKYELDNVAIHANVADNELIDLLDEFDSALASAGVALNPGK